VRIGRGDGGGMGCGRAVEAGNHENQAREGRETFPKTRGRKPLFSMNPDE
jgi:hypothetical protein